MSNSNVRLTNSVVVQALNNKADRELENSNKASEIESIANSAASAAQSASTVANAANTLINTTVQEIDKDLANTKTEINNTLESTKTEINTSVTNKLASCGTKLAVSGSTVKLQNSAGTDLSSITVGNTAKAYITETYSSGSNWYRIWSDGWKEQGGLIDIGSWTSITLLKPFSNIKYTLTVGGGNGPDGGWPCGNITSTTEIYIGARGTASYSNEPAYYYCCGY